MTSTCSYTGVCVSAIHAHNIQTSMFAHILVCAERGFVEEEAREFYSSDDLTLS